MQNRKTNDRVNFTSAMILRAAGGHDRALRKRAAIVRESEQTAFHPYHHSGTKVLPLLPSHQRDPTIHGLTIPSSPPQHLSSCSSQIVFRVSFSLTHSLYTSLSILVSLPLTSHPPTTTPVVFISFFLQCIRNFFPAIPPLVVLVYRTRVRTSTLLSRL